MKDNIWKALKESYYKTALKKQEELENMDNLMSYAEYKPTARSAPQKAILGIRDYDKGYYIDAFDPAEEILLNDRRKRQELEDYVESAHGSAVEDAYGNIARIFRDNNRLYTPWSIKKK